MEIKSTVVTHVTWKIAELFEDLFFRITTQFSKASFVRAPLRGYPRSGARTMDDFASLGVLFVLTQ